MRRISTDSNAWPLYIIAAVLGLATHFFGGAIWMSVAVFFVVVGWGIRAIAYSHIDTKLDSICEELEAGAMMRMAILGDIREITQVLEEIRNKLEIE